MDILKKYSLGTITDHPINRRHQAGCFVNHKFIKDMVPSLQKFTIVLRMDQCERYSSATKGEWKSALVPFFRAIVQITG